MLLLSLHCFSVGGSEQHPRSHLHINPGFTPAAHSASPGKAAMSGSGEAGEARHREQGASERATSGTTAHWARAEHVDVLVSAMPSVSVLCKLAQFM